MQRDNKESCARASGVYAQRMTKHPLKVWCDADGRKLAWVADKIGISRSHLSGFLSGRTKVPLDRALAIEDLTDGAVPARSWLRGDSTASS